MHSWSTLFRGVARGAGGESPHSEALPPYAPNEMTLYTGVYEDAAILSPGLPSPPPLAPSNFEKSAYAPNSLRVE